MVNKSGAIYWYQCSDLTSDDEYIGETSRTFGEGYKEHLALYHRDQRIPHNKQIPHTVTLTKVKQSAHQRTAHIQALTPP